VEEGGEAGGGGRTLLGLESYPDDVEGCDWEVVSRVYVSIALGAYVPRRDVKMLPLTAESIFCESVAGVSAARRAGGVSSSPFPGEVPILS